MKNSGWLFLAFISLASGCDSMFLGGDEAIDLQENLQPPPALNDGWDVSTPEAENIDAEMIHKAVGFLHDNEDANVHSLLIVRNNRLVLESYFNGWNRDRKHDLRSATKSFTSCLVGIAIDKGFLPSTEVPVYSFFPEYKLFDNWDERKASIPIRHFLQMRTGFACNDWFPGSVGNEEKMYRHED